MSNKTGNDQKTEYKISISESEEIKDCSNNPKDSKKDNSKKQNDVSDTSEEKDDKNIKNEKDDEDEGGGGGGDGKIKINVSVEDKILSEKILEEKLEESIEQIEKEMDNEEYKEDEEEEKRILEQLKEDQKLTIPKGHKRGYSFNIKAVNASEIINREMKTPSRRPHDSMELEALKPPAFLKHSAEDITLEKWKNHKKHIFILSEAGKPIFTRYGNESDLNPMMAFFTTILSHIQHQKDVLRTIYGSKNFKITFLCKGCLNFIGITRTNESSKEVAKQLNYIYLQLVLILTEKLQEVLNKKKSFDLRNLLGGTDSALHSLISVMSNSINYAIKAYPCLKFPKKLRSIISDKIGHHSIPKLLYTALISGKYVIQVVRNKKRSLKVEDLLLLINFVNSSKALRSHQIWTPVCLPGLSPVGYVYAYIEYIEKSTDLCLIFINADHNTFFECAALKESIIKDLKSTKIYDKLLKAINKPEYTIDSMKISAKNHVRHFLYKNQKGQYTSCQFAPPYNLKKEKKRIIRIYKSMREKVLYSNANFKLFFERTKTESLIVWVSNGIELFVTFSYDTTKKQATELCERIKKWIRTEEDHLFLNDTTFK